MKLDLNRHEDTCLEEPKISAQERQDYKNISPTNGPHSQGFGAVIHTFCLPPHNWLAEFNASTLGWCSAPWLSKTTASLSFAMICSEVNFFFIAASLSSSIPKSNFPSGPIYRGQVSQSIMFRMVPNGFKSRLLDVEPGINRGKYSLGIGTFSDVPGRKYSERCPSSTPHD